VIWIGAVLGVLLCAAGVVFIGQGLDAIHGSTMTGHPAYAGLGAVCVVLGLLLLVGVWRARGPRA
jgi:hypothetical protein